MSSPNSYQLIGTAIGPVGLVWTPAAIAEVWLPNGPTGAMRARLGRRFTADDAPPVFVTACAAGVRGLLSGAAIDLADVSVDLSALGGFDRAVLEFIRGIPPGSTLTYGEVARALGEPGAAQSVGRALGRNPVPIVVPCHRVVGASSVGGFSAPGGTATKLRILEIESAYATGPVQESLPF